MTRQSRVFNRVYAPKRVRAGAINRRGGARTRLSRQVFPFHVGAGQRESSVHVVGKSGTVELRAA